MAKKTLTVQLINSALVQGRYYDIGFHGLHLHVRQSGSKAWVQRTRLGQKYIDIGVGGYPIVKLADARRIATTNKGLIEQGIDPRQDTHVEKQIPTFKQVAEDEIVRVQAQSKNEKHKRQWRSTLEQYAYPFLGHLKVDEITVEHIRKVLEPIWETKTETAQRVRGRIQNVLDLAIVRGQRDQYNPAIWQGNLKKLLPNPSKIKFVENHPAISLGDIQRWWQELLTRDGVGKKALQLKVLTLVRTGNILGMEWDELEFFEGKRSEDFGCKAMWTIPAAKMKMNAEHRIPLQLSAVEILRSIKPVENTKLVFPSSKGGPLSDMTMSAVMRRMHGHDFKLGRGYVDTKSKRPAVPHGFRSTFRDWAAEKGYAREVAELQLSHSVGSEVERAYRRTDMVAKRAAMMEAWSEFVCGGTDA